MRERLAEDCYEIGERENGHSGAQIGEPVENAKLRLRKLVEHNHTGDAVEHRSADGEEHAEQIHRPIRFEKWQDWNRNLEFISSAHEASIYLYKDDEDHHQVGSCFSVERI